MGWNTSKEQQTSRLTERTPGGLRIGLEGSRAVGIPGCGKRPAGVLGRQTLPNLLELGLVGRRPQAIVADLVDAGGQNVLKEATDELLGRYRHRTPLVVCGVLVAEGDLAVFDAQDAAVGDGDPVDVAPEVRQDVLGALDGGLAVDHPLLPAHESGIATSGRALAIRSRKMPLKMADRALTGTR